MSWWGSAIEAPTPSEEGLKNTHSQPLITVSQPTESSETFFSASSDSGTSIERPIFSSLLKRASSLRRTHDDLIETDDLKTVVTSSLPSKLRRQETLCRESSRHILDIPRGRESAKHKIISDLAETISNANRIVSVTASPSACSSGVDRHRKMSVHLKNYGNGSLSRRMTRRSVKRGHHVTKDEMDFMHSPKSHRYRDSLWDMEAEAVRVVGRSHVFKLIITSIKDWQSSLSYHINFWSQHFKEIEGQTGIAMATYFRFVSWLVKINLLVFVLFLCFLYIPQWIADSDSKRDIFRTPVHANISDIHLQEAIRCTDAYYQYQENVTKHFGISVVLDIFKGTGVLDTTMIFIGHYTNLTLTMPYTMADWKYLTDYNMGLAYMLTVGFSFVIVFIMIIKNSSRSIRDTVIGLDNKALPHYVNSVLCGWDYCINSEKMAYYKQKIIHKTFQAKLLEVKLDKERRARSRKYTVKLYITRIVINFIVILILGGCFATIYFTTNFLLEKQDEDLGEIESLVIQFMPSIIISIFNIVVPFIFILLVEKEDYPPAVATSLTIIRSVFLRLSLVGVLIVSLYYRLQYNRKRDTYACPEEGIQNDTSKCCGNVLWRKAGTDMNSVKCWETYVGQQFYKLVIADYFNICVFLYGFAWMRKVIWDKFNRRSKFINEWALQPFDLPLEVLDLIYSQTLCWVGMFFSPMIPTLTLVKIFINFFIKKHTLLALCEPPKNTHRASNSYSFFQLILLVSFIIICIILGYMVGNIEPSKSCGPFRVYSGPDYVMFTVITNTINSWPDIPRGIVRFFGTVAFFMPAYIVLALAIYYYWAVSEGYKTMEDLLQENLKSEAFDKQFLLARVDEIIKRGQLSSRVSLHSL